MKSLLTDMFRIVNFTGAVSNELNIRYDNIGWSKYKIIFSLIQCNFLHASSDVLIKKEN